MVAERKRPSADARVFAPEHVRLRYATDARAGYRRERAGDGFRYRDRDGRLIRDDDEVARIQRIAIPPAWEDVWISPVANGHLQATGRDARGRKQYRYHPEFRRQRDEAKYARMIEFGRALPRIRKCVDRDLARRNLGRERVLATIVSLLERTFMRVGNEQYARENRSYGLTTLRMRHVAVDGPKIRFHFRGKSGLVHDVGLRDRRLARVVRQIQDLPGQELFQYRDENGELRDVESEDVNRYLREAAGADVTAKDFRTWAGTLLAFRVLRESRSSGGRAAQQAVKASTEAVAEVLGNTPTVSRTSYIAPRVVDAYLAGDLPNALTKASEASDRLQPGANRREELALIRLLENEREGTRAGAPAQERVAGAPRLPSSPMELLHRVTGPVATNVWVLGDEATREALAVDTATPCIGWLTGALAERGWTLKLVVSTHRHWDHIGDNAAVVEATGAQLAVHSADRHGLLDPGPALGAPFPVVPSVPAIELAEGSRIRFGGITLDVLHTPGHTEGSVCLLAGSERLVISGDTLFRGAWGRTDLYGGDDTQMIDSLARLAELPPDLRVLPGHGADTTIERELAWLDSVRRDRRLPI